MLIVLGGGFVIAMLVAFIVQASLGSGKKEGMVEIAIAAKAIRAGEPVTDSNFKWQNWPEDSLFVGAIQREGRKKISEMATGKLRRDVSAGEPLMQSNLTSSGKGNILAASLGPGMRAVAIKVSAESMVGGFISPSDKVDVILTYQIKLSGDEKDEVATKVDKHASQTILENVNVLAIDQNFRKEDDKAKVGRTVTLEVDANGAEKLVLASQMGDLSLALRALGDDKVPQSGQHEFTTDVQMSTLLQELGKMKKSTGGKNNNVRVYNGQNVESIPVRR